MLSLAFFAAANARLAQESNFLAAMWGEPSLRADDNCVKSEQCYFGSDPATDCCSGHVIDSPMCSSELSCNACKPTIGMIVAKLDSVNCESMGAPAAAETACNTIGLGEDSMFHSLCTSAITQSCEAIASAVKGGLTDPEAVCKQIGFCSPDGSTSGSKKDVFGVKCGCVEGGYCTLHQDGCCGDKSSWNIGCVPPLSMCDS